MRADQAAAYVFSQAVAALAEIQGMDAENRLREIQGASPAYGESAFANVISKYGIDHNSVIGLFREAV